MHLCSALFCFHERRHCSRFSRRVSFKLIYSSARQDMKASRLKGWNILPALPRSTLSLSLAFIPSQIQFPLFSFFYFVGSDNEFLFGPSMVANSLIKCDNFYDVLCPPVSTWALHGVLINGQTPEIILWQRKTQKLQNKTGTQLPLPTAEGLHSRPTRATSNSLASHENIQNYFSVQIKRMIIIHSRIQAHAHNRRHQQRHNGFFYSCNGILPIIQLTSFRASLCLVPLCRRRLRRRWRRSLMNGGPSLIPAHPRIEFLQITFSTDNMASSIHFNKYVHRLILIHPTRYGMWVWMPKSVLN